MADPDLADYIIAQGKALMCAIESLGTIEPSGPLDHLLSHLLLAAYRRRLRSVVAVATADIGR
jgi:hypothetical protein